MKSTWEDQTTKDTKRPMKFIYYMAQIPDSPCKICVVQPLCTKSFLDNTACRGLAEFIIEKTEEIQHEDKN